MIQKIRIPYSGGLPATQAIGASFLQLISAFSAKLDEVIDVINRSKDIDINAVIAPHFSSSVAYSAGDYVEWEGVIYKALAAIPAGGWDASKWEQVSIAAELELIRDKLANLDGYIPLIESVTTKQPRYIEAVRALPVQSWDSSNRLSVLVPEATPEDSIDIAPSVESIDTWSDAGVRAISVSDSHQITFQCKAIPNETITAQIRIWKR